MEHCVVVCASDHAGACSEKAKHKEQAAARVAGGYVAALAHAALVRKGEVTWVVLVREADLNVYIRQARLRIANKKGSAKRRGSTMVQGSDAS